MNNDPYQERPMLRSASPIAWLISVLTVIHPLYAASGTNSQPPTKSDVNYQKICSDFIVPSEHNKVWCYWYWINDNVSMEGITKDLEAMKRVGIGAALIGHINLSGTDGPTPLFSDPWRQCVIHAVNEGKRIGVDIGMFNCPGWSQSGGPWVKPEMAMRHVVYSQTDITGPGKQTIPLSKPSEAFQDIAVMAFPAIPSERIKLTHANSGLSASPSVNNPENLIDCNTATEALFEKDSNQFTIEIKTRQPITARSIFLYPAKGRLYAQCSVSAFINGDYVPVKSFVYDRSDNASVGPDIFGPVAMAIAPAKSNAFRFIFRTLEKINDQTGLSEIFISERAVLENYVEKNLGKMYPMPDPKWDSYIWKQQTPIEDDQLQIDPHKMLLLSDKMNADGQLVWDVPDGQWTVLRFGMVPTGARNSPSAPQGRGYEIDKANRKLIRSHFEQFIGRLLEQIPKETVSSFKYVIADSYEVGSQNWTDGFERNFESRYGYNPIPYLPVFSGRIVGSAEESDRFLWDIRRFVADSVAYEYVGGLRQISEEHQLQVWLENYGHWGYPSEFLLYGGQSNLVGGEYWNEGTLGNIECKAASSAYHIYNKPMASAEAFTAASRTFLRYPALLKQRGDWSFTEGINHIVLHVYIHQPDDKKTPGINAWFGTEFNRQNTWFEQSKSWIDYIRRCQHLLQQGKYAADVCYFISEEAPMMTGAQIPPLPGGYSFDYINAEVIMNRLAVKDGKFILPDGMTYSMMILPPVDTMRPGLLAKIEELVRQGGVIYGSPPVKSPSLENYPQCDQQVRQVAQKLWNPENQQPNHIKKYGKGYVVDNLDISAALQTLNIRKDVELNGDFPVLWTHRTLPQMEIYFLTNQSDQQVTFAPSFRTVGMKPQLWDPVNGSMRPLPEYKESNQRTQIPVKMQPRQSFFVVFAGGNDKIHGKASATNFPEKTLLQTIDTEWTVDFLNKDIGPNTPVKCRALTDWTQFEDEKIRYYSGAAVYQTSFNVKNLTQNAEYFLDLGEVCVIASGKLNGINLGTTWIAPHTLNVTGILKEGENTLEINVANLWRNRLVKDLQLPEDQRYTWHLVDDITPDEKLQPSGLLGPVTLQYSR